MKFGIKNPMLFIAKLEQISKFLSHAMVSFYKGKISISGVNSDNTLFVNLELCEEALVGYELVKTDDYAFNISAFLNATKDAKRLKFEFKAGLLIITTYKGKAAISTIKLRHSEEQKELDFDATFDINPYIPIFNDCRIKAKAVFPIRLEGDFGEGMKLKMIVAPTKCAAQLLRFQY